MRLRACNAALHLAAQKHALGRRIVRMIAEQTQPAAMRAFKLNIVSDQNMGSNGRSLTITLTCASCAPATAFPLRAPAFRGLALRDPVDAFRRCAVLADERNFFGRATALPFAALRVIHCGVDDLLASPCPPSSSLSSLSSSSLSSSSSVFMVLPPSPPGSLAADGLVS